jgi:glutamate 5-kinase
MLARENLKNKKRIIVKVGTSNITYANGKLNFRRIEKLARVLSDIHNRGKDVLLVSSGAIAVGSGKLGYGKRPESLAEKQAVAAIGQAELMKIYQKIFEEYNQKVAQILLTKDIITDELKMKNAKNTLNALLKLNVIPIINENDTVATDEIEALGYGDNDRLSADVATVAEADLLVILSDIEGLYSTDPKSDSNARIITRVNDITSEIEKMAQGSKNAFAKGGMLTKIEAIKICYNAGIDTVITNGNNPDVIFSILEGKEKGTLFVAPGNRTPVKG